MPIQVPLSFQVIPGGNDPAVAPIGLHTNANVTLTSKVETVYVDTTGGPYTVTMPASPGNYEHKVLKDIGGGLSLEACTINGNGHQLEQDDGTFAATYSMTENRQIVAWRYSATLTKWVRTSAGGGGAAYVDDTVKLTPTTWGTDTYTPSEGIRRVLIDTANGDVTINLSSSPVANQWHWIHMFGGYGYEENSVAPGSLLHSIVIAGQGTYNTVSPLKLNMARPTALVAWDGAQWVGWTVPADPAYYQISPIYIGPPPGPYTATLPKGSMSIGVDGSNVLGVGFDLTLPEDVDGTVKIIKDISNTAAARNILIYPTSGNIQGFDGSYVASLTMDSNGDAVQLIKTSFGWGLL